MPLGGTYGVVGWKRQYACEAMRVALYLRRSTNEWLQPESLTVQEERLREYAASHAMTVVSVFADSASGTSVKHRDGFHRLLSTVERGAPFRVVLVRDVTRLGTLREHR